MRHDDRSSLSRFGFLLAMALMCQALACQTVRWVERPALPFYPSNAHAMAFDSARGRCVVLTGVSSVPPNQTWEYDGVAWFLRTPAVSPPARQSAAMAFDSVRNVTVLFGGDNGVQYPMPADHWDWDGVTWTQHTPALLPPARVNPVMAFDVQRGRVVMQGGSTAGSTFTDTWTWQGTRWTKHTNITAPPDSGRAMAYDIARGRVMLWIYGSGLWEWGTGGWMQPPQTGSLPVGLLGDAEFEYHPMRGTTILAGGVNAITSIYSTTTWEWNGTAWAIVPGTVPGRIGHQMAYDSWRHRMVMVGGLQSTVGRGCTELATNPVTPVATAYGTGCGSGPLALAPYQNDKPVLGFPYRTVVSPVATTMPFVALGFSDTQFGPTPLPIPLDSFGATGCVLLQSAEITNLACQPATAGTARNTINLPNSPGLAGAVVFLQAWLSAPGQNAAGIVLSNGLRVTIGD
jgi:hypothetical protein